MMVAVSDGSYLAIYVVVLVLAFGGPRWWRRRAGFRLPPRGPGATAPSRLVRTYVPPLGGRYGSLTVGPGRIQLDTFIRSKQMATQTDGPVLAVRSRFWPLSWRRGFILRGDSWWLGVSAATASARSISKELREAGFEIEDRSTWFALFPTSPAAYLPHGNRELA